VSVRVRFWVRLLAFACVVLVAAPARAQTEGELDALVDQARARAAHVGSPFGDAGPAWFVDQLLEDIYRGADAQFVAGHIDAPRLLPDVIGADAFVEAWLSTELAQLRSSIDRRELAVVGWKVDPRAQPARGVAWVQAVVVATDDADERFEALRLAITGESPDFHIVAIELNGRDLRAQLTSMAAEWSAKLARAAEARDRAEPLPWNPPQVKRTTWRNVIAVLVVIVAGVTSLFLIRWLDRDSGGT
jgi:hypothetical protein